MAPRPNVDDRLIRWIGIPVFGIAIPLLCRLYGPHGPGDGAFWLGAALFVGLAWVIWHGNRWLLWKQQEHADWFAQPFQKILLLLVGIVFGTVPITLLTLLGWYRFAGFAQPDWEAIRLVCLTNVICVVFVTHVYETVFLIKARQEDLVEVERLSRARLEAELEALKAQIDPHFLFNALNTLGWLISADTDKAQAFTAALGRVYRYILASRGRSLVLLGEEMDFMNDYLSLLALRFEDAIRVHLKIEERLLDRRMLPPITLQVLVENAIKHNEFSREQPLELSLEVTAEEVSLWNPRRPRLDPAPGTGAGLRNLAERYRLATAREIDVTDAPDSFVVRLPLLAA